MTTPKKGKATMYTSGWPKNQNRCCQSTGVPPFCTSKMLASRCRSANSMASAAVSTGNASSTMTLVTSMFQVKIGIRNIVMPGARSMKIVVTRLTAPSTVAVLVTMTPTIHRSGPAPGEYVAPESGAYANHPKFAAPLGGEEARDHREPAEQVQPVARAR